MVTAPHLDAREENVYVAGCASRAALERIADKWALLLVLVLERRPYHFNELRRAIGGLSQKMLTQTLRNLERDGLVLREVYPTTPPQVEYSLTPVGRTLCIAFQGMADWAHAHVDDVLAARAAFDTRQIRQPLPQR